jgi:predicted nucleotidyltransferase
MNPNNFGLLKRDLDFIFQAVLKFPEIEKAIIFGSRAMGNYKKGSDIDLAIVGEKITYQIKTRLSSIINQELPIPYFIDVVDYKSITNKDLVKHIDTEGKVIYKRREKSK